jgi:hypothetical protein
LLPPEKLRGGHLEEATQINLQWSRKMKLKQVHKKLEEAEFFLSLMCGEERREIGNRDWFDFFLSAFLSAARTVDYRLRHERAAIYRDWRAAWNASQKYLKFSDQAMWLSSSVG